MVISVQSNGGANGTSDDAATGNSGHKISGKAHNTAAATPGGGASTNNSSKKMMKRFKKDPKKLSPSAYTGTRPPPHSETIDEESSAAAAAAAAGDHSSATSTDSSIHSSHSATSKLTKIGQRLRDSCRNLRAKHSSGGGHCPDDYTSIQAHNESQRSKHYVPMDFSGKEGGRIVDLSDLPGNCPTKEGYTYFRRKCMSANVKNLLTETQDTVHLTQPWFHKGVGRDLSQKILATHAIDGLFLVRNSSVAGGFVISYYFAGKTHHSQALPDATDGCATYSLDEGRTRFFDLLQMVEYYQLNRGTLSHRLTHYVVSLENAISMGYDVKTKPATKPRPAAASAASAAAATATAANKPAVTAAAAAKPTAAAAAPLAKKPQSPPSPELTKNGSKLCEPSLSPSSNGGGEASSTASSDMSSSVPTAATAANGGCTPLHCESRAAVTSSTDVVTSHESVQPKETCHVVSSTQNGAISAAAAAETSAKAVASSNGVNGSCLLAVVNGNGACADETDESAHHINNNNTKGGGEATAADKDEENASKNGHQ